ncbi:MAG: redox-sensing transcriptional repressor Rex [Candidatus Margulisiibacteriota bacterium]
MNVSNRIIARLSLYYRCLYNLAQQGTFSIASKNLAALVGLKPDQVRKDLSYFGKFGKPRVGYNVLDLKGALARILGLEQGRRVAIVGMGNLGQALVGYKGFEELGFKIVAAFDNSPNKIGKKYRGKYCYNIGSLATVCRQEGVEMVILTVPTEAAQSLAQEIAKAGVKAILNFAPVQLSVPKGVKVNNVDLASELKSMSFFVYGQKNLARKH